MTLSSEDFLGSSKWSSQTAHRVGLAGLCPAMRTLIDFIHWDWPPLQNLETTNGAPQWS